VAKEGMVVKEISSIKKKPSTLHQDTRKDALRAFQELTRSHLLKAQGCKSVNSLEILCFGKRVPENCSHRAT
jgi:hypothetical protein